MRRVVTMLAPSSSFCMPDGRKARFCNGDDGTCGGMSLSPEISLEEEKRKAGREGMREEGGRRFDGT